jgi:hypothetical protein
MKMKRYYFIYFGEIPVHNRRMLIDLSKCPKRTKKCCIEMFLNLCIKDFEYDDEREKEGRERNNYSDNGFRWSNIKLKDIEVTTTTDFMARRISKKTILVKNVKSKKEKPFLWYGVAGGVCRMLGALLLKIV